MKTVNNIAALTAVFMMSAPAQAAYIADLQNHSVVPDTKFTNCAREALRTYNPDGHVFQAKINDPQANYNGIPADNGFVYQMIMYEPSGLEAGIDVYTIHNGRQEAATIWAFRGNEGARRAEIQGYMAACIS